jgi:hypothetical protein
MPSKIKRPKLILEKLRDSTEALDFAFAFKGDRERMFVLGNADVILGKRQL